MNKIFKLLSICIALICLFTGCSQKSDVDEAPKATTTYCVVKQEIAPAPFGANMNVHYNMDGQMSKIEFFHPEFPDEMVFNYDNSSKLSNIVAIYNDDESGYTDEKCIAELQYTKNENNCFVGKADINNSYYRLDLLRALVVVDSANEHLNADAFSFIYNSMYDIVGKSDDMEYNDFILVSDCITELSVVYTNDLKLKEFSILYSLTKQQLAELPSVQRKTWEYKKAYDSNGLLAEWVLGGRKTIFEYDENLNNIVTTRYVDDKQESVTTKKYENDYLSEYKQTFYDGEAVTAEFTTNGYMRSVGLIDSNGNQISKIELSGGEGTFLTKTLQIKNNEMRQNILKNQDMWAFKEEDFPNLELVTHKFTYKEISSTY